MRNNDRYQLLYNQLWVGTPSKVRLFNSDYVHPEYLESSCNLKLASAALEVPITTLKPEMKSQIKFEVAFSIPDVVLQPVAVNSSSLDHDLIKDWDVLVDQINNCTKCGLCAARKNVVIERGSRNASWMFIGEGPGEQEDASGIPFVGASGQLLDKMIAAMKLDKDRDVYICNVVKCRPPYNRNPEPSEILLCKNYLLSQIDNVKPRLIIALGRFASQTLLESNVAIGKLRNKLHYFQNIPMIVTYHPSYLLRNPSAKKEAWDDLQLAMRTYK